MNGSEGTVRKFRKVQYGYYSSRTLDDEKSSAPHPVIRIAGKYLEKFGFRIGDAITVEIADGRIEVMKISEPGGNYSGEGESADKRK